MTKIRSLMRNRNFIFAFALAAGLLFDKGAYWTAPCVLPALSVVMTLSMLNFPNSALRSLRSFIVPAFFGIFMNYVILGNFIIGMSAFLIQEEQLWIGFIIMAAMPPAVAVRPFAAFLNGNEPHAVAGTMGAYIGALIIIPLMALGLLDMKHIHTDMVFATVMALIVIPLVFSRFLLWKRLNEKIEPLKGILTDWSFFFVLYTLVGLNRETIIGQPLFLMPSVMIAFASTFLLGFTIGVVATIVHCDKDTLTSLLLLGTLKNYGLAGGLAVLLFSREAALPAIVVMTFMILYKAWLDFKMRWA
jgi:BASS family bile acid:Na+ symporter